MRNLCFVLVTLAAQAGAATLLFSDLGTGGSVYDGSTGSQVSGSGSGAWITQARSFTVSGSGDFLLTQFDLGVFNYAPAPATFSASVWTSSADRPSVELGSWDLSTTEPFGSCCALVTQSGITGITLTGGVQYWMVLGPQGPTDSSRNAWADNTQGVNGQRLGSLDGGATWIDDGTGTDLAFDVLGDPVNSAPEPSSMLLLGAALTGMFTVRRRPSRR